jgi:hypothetical protein
VVVVARDLGSDPNVSPLTHWGPQGLVAICALIWIKWARAALAGRFRYIVLPVAMAATTFLFLSSSVPFAGFAAEHRMVEWDAHATMLMYAFAAATFVGQFVDIVLPTRQSDSLEVFETRLRLERSTRALVVVVAGITFVRAFA